MGKKSHLSLSDGPKKTFIQRIRNRESKEHGEPHLTQYLIAMTEPVINKGLG